MFEPRGDLSERHSWKRADGPAGEFIEVVFFLCLDSILRASKNLCDEMHANYGPRAI